MPSVVSFGMILKKELKEFQDACEAVGGPVAELGKLVASVFNEQKAMIDKATKMKRPSHDEMETMLGPTEKALMKVESVASDLADENPDLKNHLQMIAGAMSSMGWVTSCEPKNLISDALNAVPVFAKYLDEREGEEHKALVVSLKTLLRTLRDYADKYHNAGLAWNSWNAQAQTSLAKKAVDASGVSGSVDTERYRYPAAEILGDYDMLLRDKVVPFVQAAYGLGGEMVAIADCVQKAFKAQRDFLEQVTASRKPSDDDLEEILEETSEVLVEIADWEEAEGEMSNHLKLVANGMAALAWVSLDTPVTYVTEVVNSLPVFSDKVLKEAAQRRKREKEEREKEEKEKGGEAAEDDGPDLDTELVTRFRDAIRGVLGYVKQYHSQGLQWNPNGKQLTLQ